MNGKAHLFWVQGYPKEVHLLAFHRGHVFSIFIFVSPVFFDLFVVEWFVLVGIVVTFNHKHPHTLSHRRFA